MYEILKNKKRKKILKCFKKKKDTNKTILIKAKIKFE